MRAHEFIVERKKKRKQPRGAAYGPGPYGGYGYYAGYSGDGGSAGGDGGGESIKYENMDHSKDDQAVPQLKTALLARKEKLQSASDDQVYDIIDTIMTRIAKAHGISGQKLHDMWVDEYDQIPDTWIMKENFADGKNPGRKGLAKRSGVNTKASVSSLRKTAKNSTGEKARMAHWLANMKAGRAKAEDIEEGWKDWVAGAAMGAASLGAAGDADAAVKKDLSKPPIQQVVKKKEIKPVAPPKATEKELAKSVTGNPHEVFLRKAAEKAGIQGQELVAFLSQCAHETLDFKHMKEIGGSLDFRKYDPKYAPKKAKALGNKQVGDGAKYKGRGYIQLTGRDNYKRAGQALGLPLEQQPELVEKPEVAAKVAVWYWNSRVASKVDNFKNTADVTKTINPGMKHLDQRKEKQQSFQVAMR